MFNRTRWSALGAAVAVTLTAGVALPSANATNSGGGGAGGLFVPIVPCRLFDTRATSTVGPRSAPLAANDTFTQPVTGAHGNCTIPTQATGVAMNVTAVNPTATSYLTVYPSDAKQPTASNLNWVAGAPPTPNKVDVKLSADGQINLFNNGGTVDVIGDIVGYYTDHDHDDRYYTKAQVDAAVAAVPPPTLHQDIYPPSALKFLGGGTYGTASNCATNPTNTFSQGIVPLVVPVGVQLLSVDVTMYEMSSGPTISVGVTREDLGAAGLQPTTIGVVQTRSGNGSMHFGFAPTSTEITTSTASYEIALTTLMLNFNYGFCQAVVTYKPVS
jgi:hypothetical protein